MTSEAWSIINAAIASIAAVAGVAAAWAAIRVYRKQSEVDYPTVSAIFDDGFFVLRVENITGTEWQIARLELPKGSSGNLLDRLSKTDDFYGDLVPLDPIERASLMLIGTIPIGYHLHPYGTAGSAAMMGRPDLQRVKLAIQSSRPRVSMRLILLSCEARQREKVIKITRDVPASARIAND